VNVDVEVFICSLPQNPLHVWQITNNLNYEGSRMLMPLLVSENFRCLTFLALGMVAARRSNKYRGLCYVKPCFLATSTDLPPRMLCTLRI